MNYCQGVTGRTQLSLLTESHEVVDLSKLPFASDDPTQRAQCTRVSGRGGLVRSVGALTSRLVPKLRSLCTAQSMADCLFLREDRQPRADVNGAPVLRALMLLWTEKQKGGSVVAGCERVR